MKKVLITSALPYVNNIPHLGNIVGCVLPADILARYYRAIGREVLYICGADEYGTATEVKAYEENTTPREVCDKYFALHKQVYDFFRISFDYFGRTSTTSPKDDEWLHTEIAQDIFQKLSDNGYLQTQSLDVLFSPDLNKFCADRFIIGTCPECNYEKARGDQCDHCGKLLNSLDLKNPVYKLNTSYKLVPKTSEHIFLDLPKLEPALQNWLATSKSGWSENAISVTKAWLKKGLKPRCISRDLEWGTPIRNSNKVMYNWFDAPIGYISITANLTENWKDWWKNPENVELIQTYSKDNIVFHTIIFPATLLGTHENYTLVNKVVACEYLNYEGTKFSKTDNIGIFGDQVIDISQKLGINADYWRYYLIKIRPETQDSSFVWDDFVSVCNTDLVNTFGNFVNRCISLAKKYGYTSTSAVDFPEWSQKLQLLADVYHENMLQAKLKKCLAISLKMAKLGNEFLQVHEPWKSHSQDVIGFALWMVALTSTYFSPFLPITTNYLLDYIGCIQNNFDLRNTISLKKEAFVLPFKKMN